MSDASGTDPGGPAGADPVVPAGADPEGQGSIAFCLGSSAGPVRRLRYDCAVKECLPSVFGVHSFHRLPNKDSRGRPDPRRELWIQACELPDADLRKRLVICSKHFQARTNE